MQKKSLFLTLTTHSSNSEFSMGLDLCVIELTVDSVKYLIDKIDLMTKIYQEDTNISMLDVFYLNQNYFHIEPVEGGDPAWIDIDGVSMLDKLLEYGSEEFAFLPTKLNVEEDDYVHMNGLVVHCDNNEVYWSGRFGCCDTQIETGFITRKDLEKALRWLEI